MLFISLLDKNILLTQYKKKTIFGCERIYYTQHRYYYKKDSETEKQLNFYIGWVGVAERRITLEIYIVHVQQCS